MHKKFIIAIALITILAPFEMFASGQADKNPQVIKLEHFRQALWKVHVTVRGKSGDFLLDTGGGVTLLTDDFSKGLDCKFWGRTTGYNMFGQRGDGPHCDNLQLSAGDVPLTPVSAGKINFGDRFGGDKTPDGLLSLDAFDGKAFTLDQIAGTLTIETTKSLARRTRSMKEMPLRIARECSARCLSAFVGVSTPEGLMWLNLDSGAGGVSLIAKDYASIFGLDPSKKQQQLKYEIAPGLPIDSPVIVTDMIMDGNLGQPFMSRYLITFDLANGRLWLAKAR
jgi:hypothetical protein